MCLNIISPISANASSEANSEWTAARAIDANSNIGWSSNRIDSDTGDEWIEVDLGDWYDVYKISLVPRFKNGGIFAFPVDFTIYYKSDYDKDYVEYDYWENVQVSNQNEEFDLQVYARYIKIKGTKFSLDPDGNYRMQIMEITPHVRCNLITTPSPERTPTPSPERTPTPSPEQSTPTPEPLEEGCCDQRDYSVQVITGSEENESINQVSVVGSPTGTLCWNELTGFSSPSSYLVSFEDDTFSQGGLQISITGNLTDKTFRYTTQENICYEGILEDTAPTINVFNRI